MMHLLPQLPCRNRYSEDWIEVWSRELRNLGMQFKVLGSEKPVAITKYFTDPDKALQYECQQIEVLVKANPEKIFCLDVEFPGLISPALQVLRLMNPDLKAYGFLHAGIWGNKDIWAGTKGRRHIDRMIFDTFDRVFVASKYHKKKIEQYYGEEFDNIVVVGFPFYRKDVLSYVKPLPYEKKDRILINGRLEQSNVDLIEKIGEKFKDEEIAVVDAENRKEYYNQLNHAKIVLSLKTEETFGIGQLEAFVLGGIPLCPDAFAYPEIIGAKRLLYSDEWDLMDKLAYLLELKENPFCIDVEKYEQVIPTCMAGF